MVSWSVMQTAPSCAFRASSAKSARATRLSREYSVCMCISSRILLPTGGIAIGSWRPMTSPAARPMPRRSAKPRQPVEGVADVPKRDEAEDRKADEEREDPEQERRVPDLGAVVPNAL